MLRVNTAEHVRGAGPEAAELITELVGQPDSGSDQSLPRAGQGAQRLGLIPVRLEHSKPVTVRAGQFGEHEAVEPVALATGNGVPGSHPTT